MEPMIHCILGCTVLTQGMDQRNREGNVGKQRERESRRVSSGADGRRWVQMGADRRRRRDKDQDL